MVQLAPTTGRRPDHLETDANSITPAASARDDVIAIEYKAFGRFANAFVTIAPMVLLGIAIWQAWGTALSWQDLLVLGVGYMLTGLGVTVGFHRLFTHRSFKTRMPIRVLLAALGSAAVEGPLIEWVSNHRMHHRFSDRPGDPHSPHVDQEEGHEHGSGWRGAVRGLLHAHVGWLLRNDHRASPERYAPDLLADPVMRWMDRLFPLLVLLGLALPFGAGVALTGTVVGGLLALLWGGAVRIMILHHATFSVNSLCHYFGRRRFETGDESRNLAWLALPTFGEAWHNNHHAFPTSAHHGLGRRQLDLSGALIDLLERTGLAWDVVRIAPSSHQTKLLAASGHKGGV